MSRVLVAFLLVFAGCTHAPELFDERRDPAPAGPPLRGPVRIELKSRVGNDPRLAQSVARALRWIPEVTLASPWAPSFDYRVELTIERRATSVGTNFFVCWPGFLVFAPAWHGLEWPYRVTTTVFVSRADGTRIANLRRSDLYTFRYTSSGYGIAAGLGWVPPFLTVPAFLGGVVSAFVPETWVLHEVFLALGAADWADRVAADALSAIATDERTRE